MSHKRPILAMAALLSSLAMLSDGCSSSHDNASKDPAGSHAADHDQDSDANGAPGSDVSGGDADAEAATINPAHVPRLLLTR